MWTTTGSVNTAGEPQLQFLAPPRENAVTCPRHLGGQHPVLLLCWLLEQVPSKIVRARITPIGGGLVLQLGERLEMKPVLHM